MDPRLPSTGKSAGQHAETAPGSTAANIGPGTTTPRMRRSPVRLVLTILAGLLAVVGVASLGALLLAALQGGSIWPGFAAGAFYALPVAFLLMAGLVIGSIVHRRRG